MVMGANMEGSEQHRAMGGGIASLVVEGILSLGSFALFYNFAWLYYRQRLFPHHSFTTATTIATESSGHVSDGTLSLSNAGRAFSGTFALSCCIFELIILEVAGLLNPDSSALAWRVCLGLMVLGLHVGLPFLLAFTCLGEVGLGRRNSCVGALVILLLGLMSASRLTHQEASVDDLGNDVVPPSVFSLEAGLARVGVVGVASLALLSGFGAVNLPYQQLATLFRRVPMSLVRSRERRARHTLADIGQRKRRAVVARATSSTDRSVTGGAGAGYGNPGPQGLSLVARIARVIAPGAGGGSTSQQAAEAETARLEEISRELFLEIAECRRIQEQQRRARSYKGRVLVGFGAVMFVYCLLRLWKAGVKVLWAPYAYGGGAVEGGGGGGTGDDPATRLVGFALRRHLVVDVDAEGWSELISFVLIGILVLLQTRGFLAIIVTVSRAFITSGFSMPAQVLSLLLSMLMGTYFTSSVILMRVNLPPRHRVAITAALGGMRFSFYQRWFDTFFFISGCVTAVSLLAFHLANRTSDADHHDHHASNTVKKTNAEAFSGAALGPRVGVVLKDKKG